MNFQPRHLDQRWLALQLSKKIPITRIAWACDRSVTAIRRHAVRLGYKVRPGSTGQDGADNGFYGQTHSTEVRRKISNRVKSAIQFKAALAKKRSAA